MKLFILFTLFCGIFAEEVKLPTYKANNKYIEHCKEYVSENGFQTICQTCHTGFEKSTDGLNCTRVTANIPIPPYVDGNKNIVHPEIGYDTKENKCTKKVRIVNSAGNLFEKVKDNKYVDKNAGEKSCLACAKYGTSTKTIDNVVYTDCDTCATGYLNNEGGCTPLAINPFDQKEMATNENCIYGAYEGTGENKQPKCYACQYPYDIKDNFCILPSGITDLTLEGCIKKVSTIDTATSPPTGTFTCEKCKEGYTLKGNVCKKSSFTSQYCMISDDRGNCARCMPGYYMKANQCEKCTVKLPTDNYFTGDECNALGTSACDCNPNCIRDNSNFATCKSRHCDLFSDTEMSSVNKKNPKCLRCEQGYKLDADNECVECKFDCFTDNTNTTCEKGYYMAKDSSNNNNACRKCEGRCTECISPSICVNNNIHVNYPSALNGLPCFDSNCKSCSSEDPSICYECSASFELIGGKCYQKSSEKKINSATLIFEGCGFYKQPDFITKQSSTVDFNKEYEFEYEIVPQRGDLNKIGANFYCHQYDTLPHYYRNYEGNKLTCAGKNRDPNSDCDCLPGYFATIVDKSSDCVKSTFVNCEIPLSNEICAKCKYSMVLVNDGVQKYPELRCGCQKTNQRINENGICVDCPPNCATCETVLENGKFKEVKCTKCKGEVEQGDTSGLAENNYNRNLTNQCECLEGYTNYPKGIEDGKEIIYSCYEIPSNCKNDGNYKVSKYEVTCDKCDKTGFTLSSSCMSCDVGHYPKYADNNKNVITSCERCPIAENDQTYCTECPDGVCSICNDENLNVSKSCKECNEGYSMIYVDMVKDGNPVRTPHCVKCENYCNMTTTGSGCFYVNDTNYIEYFKNKFTSKTSYTQEEFDKKINSICTDCFDGGSPASGCQCGEEKYQDKQGRCHGCSDKIGKEKFITIDASGNSIEKPYSDVCDFRKESTQDDNPVCKANSLTYLPECTVCLKKDERDPAYNCTKCIKSNTFAMFDGSNHKCEACLEKCSTCKNKKGCVSCVAPNAIGDQCDKCIPGYYKEDMSATGGSAKCVKCPEGCSECESATKCTVCSEEIRTIGPNNDCKACVSGFYYNATSNECKQVDISKGFAESKAVCLNKDDKEVDCQKTPAADIKEVLEIPVKCDTTKGVGISPYPVNRTCVCDTGYLDPRNETQKAEDPIPQCVNIKILANDDYCIDGKFVDTTSGNVTCTKCNANYLELKNGKCVCKEGYYTTTWGMCVPCNRHIKGCTKCASKIKCNECDSSAFKLGEEKNGKRECVGK